MFRFSIRDVLGLTALIALLLSAVMFARHKEAERQKERQERNVQEVLEILKREEQSKEAREKEGR